MPLRMAVRGLGKALQAGSPAWGAPCAQITRWGWEAAGSRGPPGARESCVCVCGGGPLQGPGTCWLQGAGSEPGAGLRALPGWGGDGVCRRPRAPPGACSLGASPPPTPQPGCGGQGPGAQGGCAAADAGGGGTWRGRALLRGQGQREARLGVSWPLRSRAGPCAARLLLRVLPPWAGRTRPAAGARNPSLRG